MWLFNSSLGVSADIIFKPAFSALNNKIFLRASTVAGFDTGYTPVEVKRN